MTQHKTKPLIVLIISALVLLTPIAVYAETDGQKIVREAGISVEWIDLGTDFENTVSYELSAKDSEGFYLVKATMPNGSAKYAYIDGTGKAAVPGVFDLAFPFQEGFAYVDTGLFTGMLIDRYGQKVLDLSQYIRNYQFTISDGLIRVCYVKWGVIDITGKVILPFEFQNIYSISHGIIHVSNDLGKTALYDYSGKFLIELDFGSSTIGSDSSGKAWIAYTKDGKWGVIDASGKVMIPFQYQMLNSLSDYFTAMLDGKWGIINAKGDTVVPFQYDRIGALSEGLISVVLNDRIGFINLQGELIIPCEFGGTGDFYHGTVGVLMIINNTSYCYIIDQSGNIVMGPREYFIGRLMPDNTFVGVHFDDTVMVGNMWNRRPLELHALLDEEGNRLTGFSYYLTNSFPHGFVALGRYPNLQYYGIINRHGTEIIPFVFEQIVIADDTTCIVRVADKAEDSSASTNGRIGILILPTDIGIRQPGNEKPISVFVDGLELYPDVDPIIENGRMMVLMRKIFWMLNASVRWDDSLNKAIAIKGATVIELTVGSRTAVINGESIPLDTPPMIADGRMLVPLRFVAEALDCEVSWEAENRRIYINSRIGRSA